LFSLCVVTPSADATLDLYSPPAKKNRIAWGDNLLKHYVPSEADTKLLNRSDALVEELSNMAAEETQFDLSTLMEKSDCEALISSESLMPVSETLNSQQLRLMQYRLKKLSAAFQMWDHPTK
jgi:hypothetical protein